MNGILSTSIEEVINIVETFTIRFTKICVFIRVNQGVHWTFEILIETVSFCLLILKKHSMSLLQSKTVREFDENFTRKVFGFNSSIDYYKTASLNNKLHLIKVPFLCLNAADDPFQPLYGESRLTINI